MDPTPSIEIGARLLLALGIGLLVGIERGWNARDLDSSKRVAGVRSYTLTGLLGGISGLLGALLGAWLPGLMFLGFAVLTTFVYWKTSSTQKDAGITSEIAMLVVFAIGLYAALGDMAIAAALGVAVAALLSVKRHLHTWIEHLNRLELEGALLLLVISVVFLPVLPNRGFGPGEVLNPFKMWLMVVFISTLSFVGYITIRKLGPRVGTLSTGVFGGLASSTAVTFSFARLGRKAKGLEQVLAAGIGIASSMMYLRVLLVVGAFNPAQVILLLWPLGLMAATMLAGAVVLHLREKWQDDPGTVLDIRNPTDLTTAVYFGALLGVVALVAHYAREWAGDWGVYAIAAISGLLDVDAITLNLAQQAGHGLSSHAATVSIFIAVGVNTLVKAAIVWAIAGRALGLPVAVLCVASLAAGSVGFLL